MDILLSIKPMFVFCIKRGLKKVELRKKININTKRVFVYESAPVKKITGYFDVSRIEEMDIEKLWEETKNISSVNRSFFDEYFYKKTKGFGIFFEKFIPINPLNLNLITKYAPQNYLILDKSQVEKIEKNIKL